MTIFVRKFLVFYRPTCDCQRTCTVNTVGLSSGESCNVRQIYAK